MTIKIDKDYIRASKIKEVKDLAKEFKTRYTDNDLKNAFIDTFDNYKLHNADVLKCEISAFEKSPYGEVEFNCSVEMVLEGILSMFKIRFYTDMNLEIDVNELLHEVREYKLVK